MTSSIKASFVKRFLDALAFLAMTISGICMVVLVSSFGWLVYGRYVLNNTPTWVEQMAMLLIITITFLGAAVGIHERTHLSVEMISLMVPEKVNRLVDIVIDSCLAAFGFAMLYYCQELMTFGWYRLIPLLGIPDGIRYAPVMVAGGLIFLFSLYRIVVGIQKLFATPSSVVKGGQ